MVYKRLDLLNARKCTQYGRIGSRTSLNRPNAGKFNIHPGRPEILLTWLLWRCVHVHQRVRHERDSWFHNECIGDDTKVAACRNPNYIRKTITYVLCNAGICPQCPIAKIMWKTASHAKFHWNRAIGCRVMARTIIFKMAAGRYFEFLKCSYLVIWLLSSSKCAVVYLISSKSDDYSLRYGDFTIFKMADLPHLKF